jgi:NDP-sugar pyrophosphorylase family protein
MVPINDKPLLQYTIEWLRASGVTDVVLLCGYKAEKLMEYFGDGSSLGLRIQYSREGTPLGRGGAFRQGFSYVPEGESLVIGANGDNIYTFDLADMLAFHRERRATISVLLTQLRSPYGIAAVGEDGAITGFQEKPLLPHWLNAGMYVISRDAFPLFPEVGDHEETTFPLLAKQGKLFGFKSAAAWRAVDTVKDLLDVGKEFRDRA